MQLIDTHQHLIYRDRIGYGWTARIPALSAGDFTTGDYAALTDGLGVAGSVFMETGVDASDYRAEARMVAELIAAPGSTILGQIASCRPEEDGFAGWLDESAALGVVGYRRILHEIDDELSQGGAFRRNVREIGARGLTFDLCFLARQLGIAQDLAAACPDTQLILDHCGVPDIAGADFASWAPAMTRMAAMPNVVCKLSGILAYCAPGTAGMAAIRPYVDHVLEAFGPDRILWGSDWPVVDLGGGLPGWIGITREILAGLSDGEAALIASGTARRVYRLP